MILRIGTRGSRLALAQTRMVAGMLKARFPELGFEEVILVGVDHSFETKGRSNTTVVSQGDDPNHFHAGYFGKGFRWQLPDLETSERAYRMAHQAYTRSGRQILDATIGGKLAVFPKVDYDSLF